MRDGPQLQGVLAVRERAGQGQPFDDVGVLQELVPVGDETAGGGGGVPGLGGACPGVRQALSGERRDPLPGLPAGAGARGPAGVGGGQREDRAGARIVGGRLTGAHLPADLGRGPLEQRVDHGGPAHDVDQRVVRHAHQIRERGTGGVGSLETGHVRGVGPARHSAGVSRPRPGRGFRRGRPGAAVRNREPHRTGDGRRRGGGGRGGGGRDGGGAGVAAAAAAAFTSSPNRTLGRSPSSANRSRASRTGTSNLWVSCAVPMKNWS